MHHFKKVFISKILILLIMTVLSGCNLPDTSSPGSAATQTMSAFSTAVARAQQEAAAQLTPQVTETPTAAITEVEHEMMPDEIPADIQSEINDVDSSVTASELRVPGGDDYEQGLLERPLNQEEYLPALDIQQAHLAQQSEWIYVSIAVQEIASLAGSYGIELDLDMDGRGDWLIFVDRPGVEWSTNGVYIWQDSNDDVGDDEPVESDPPQTSDGYDQLVFNQGVGEDPDLAWARTSPERSNVVEIALKYELIDRAEGFMWSVWTDGGIVNPLWFDYNDRFSPADAGSPLAESEFYPVGALAEVDNTCHGVFGFEPDGDEPGVCEPDMMSTAPTTAETEMAEAGTISGRVFVDTNGDLVYQTDEEGLSGIQVRLREGACGTTFREISQQLTGDIGQYRFTGLSSGTYCVDVPSDPVDFLSKTLPVTVELEEGGGGTADFAFYAAD